MSFYSDDNKFISDLVKQLTNNELKTFINSDQSGIDTLLSDSPQLKKLKELREQLIEANKELAESTLTLQEPYKEAEQKLAEVYQECQQLQVELDQKQAKLKEAQQQNSLDTTLALMQAAMAEAEESSEDVATRFLSKELSIDDFLEEFNEKRKVFHARRIKVEKMPEEINKLSYNNNLRPSRPAPMPPGPPMPPYYTNYYG